MPVPDPKPFPCLSHCFYLNFAAPNSSYVLWFRPLLSQRIPFTFSQHQPSSLPTTVSTDLEADVDGVDHAQTEAPGASEVLVDEHAEASERLQGNDDEVDEHAEASERLQGSDDDGDVEEDADDEAIQLHHGVDPAIADAIGKAFPQLER